ncbi:MAG: AIR synthase related protein, partial [Candidatus Sericytochromatia bacterium]|nr:AIR synthase related protein [Candidatus Sericytochromatia bacterium]
MTPTGPAGQLARVASPHATLATLGEGGVIAALGRQGAARPSGALGIGDDAALVPLGHPGVVATVDTLVEGVHFRLATTTPEDLGWKALAVNLSDLAAMGARPVAVLLALSAPASLPARWVEGLAAGLHALAARHGVWLAGGDTTGSPGPVVVSVTALGEPG